MRLGRTERIGPPNHSGPDAFRRCGRLPVPRRADEPPTV